MNPSRMESDRQRNALNSRGPEATRERTVKLCFWKFLRTFCLLLLAGGSSGILSAQTAWSVHPDAPSSLSSNAKLKYANNSFTWFGNPPLLTPFHVTART